MDTETTSTLVLPTSSFLFSLIAEEDKIALSLFLSSVSLLQSSDSAAYPFL